MDSTSMFNPSLSMGGLYREPEDNRFESMTEVNKNPKYKVIIPYKEPVPYPHHCALCCKSHATEENTYLAFFNRKNYGIKAKQEKMEFKGSKLCPDCKNRTDMSKGELILLAVSVILCILTGTIITFLNFETICLNFIIGAVGAFWLYFLGRLFIKSRAEKPPMKIEILTDKVLGGDIKPNNLKFLFRNRRYAYEFAKSNGTIRLENCNLCNNPLIMGPKDDAYCPTCNKYFNI
jgi:hypothetical protein